MFSSFIEALPISLGFLKDILKACRKYKYSNPGEEYVLFKNGLSVDLEDYFQASIFSEKINRADWASLPSRIEINTYKLLNILSDSNTKATFFVLGWIARRFPRLISDIAGEKHEIALHGYDHRLVTSMTPSDFLRDLTVTRAIVEDITGFSVAGYRAPSFSINKSTWWALEIIRSQGFKYDSSIFPLGTKKHNFCGIPSKPFEIMPGLMEIPLPVIRCAGINLPFGGGVFFRVYPYAFNRWAIRRLNQKGNAPAVIYIHPWEMDPDQPRPCPLAVPAHLRHYTNVGKFEQRFKMLIKDFSFCPLREII